MKTPTILFLNGASGAGKTTIAEKLSCSSVHWLHPDGLWETPKMDQRELTLKAVQEAILNHQCSDFVVIDSQLRHHFMLEAFRASSVNRGNQILLHCKESVRKQRLTNRGWESSRIDQMEKWAQYLHRESIEVGNVIIDTAENTIDEVVVAVKSTITEWGWPTGF